MIYFWYLLSNILGCILLLICMTLWENKKLRCSFCGNKLQKGITYPINISGYSYRVCESCYNKNKKENIFNEKSNISSI